MASRIEDYAIIGDTQTAALVGRDGSIDWMCAPRFDSAACFAALVGTRDHGRWQIAPAADVLQTRRRYRGHSLVLETEFHTEQGVVRVVDCMPPRQEAPDLVRVVEGVSGVVPMTLDLVVRFGYGSVVPWVRRVDGVWRAIAGPDALALHTPVALEGVGLATQARFTVQAGERVPFLMVWHHSHESEPAAIDALAAADDTERWWDEWCSRCTYDGPWRNEVLRSLVTLKALTYAPTGGIVAAPTTSLPERLGGVRNWDYRYCWLRDATFTLYALLMCGFTAEAGAWRNWLLRAVAGDPATLQIMYGAAGERNLPESELPWLPGYEGSRPVRIGNAAASQMQLDVYGEVLDAMHVARRVGVPPDADAWALEQALLRHLESAWREPDEGIWEVRGPRRHFTHSKVMAWVAFDRGIRAVEDFGLEGPAERWRQARRAIRDDVLRHGFDEAAGTFTQYYRGHEVDAALLMLPLVGFVRHDDPRVKGTIAAVERELLRDGFVERYRTRGDRDQVDGLPAGEGTFLPCTFWLADNYALRGRRDDAMEVFERLLLIRNDVGLLSEEYDIADRRLLGNFPQAFTHVALVNTALNLSNTGPARHRQSQGADRGSGRHASGSGPREGDQSMHEPSEPADIGPATPGPDPGGPRTPPTAPVPPEQFPPPPSPGPPKPMD